MASPTYNKVNIFKAAKQFHSFEEKKMAFKKSDGTYIDLTGLVITLEFREGSPDGVLVKKLTLTSGLSVVDEAGVKKLVIASFSIDTPGEIYYDIRMSFPLTLKTKYYVGGVVLITPSVTKQDN